MTPENFKPIVNVIDATFADIDISIFDRVIVAGDVNHIKSLISFELFNRAYKKLSNRTKSHKVTIVGDNFTLGDINNVAKILHESSNTHEEFLPNAFVKMLCGNVSTYKSLINNNVIKPADYTYYFLDQLTNSEDQLDFILNSGTEFFSIVELPDSVMKLADDPVASFHKYMGTIKFKILRPTLIVIPIIDNENMFTIQTFGLHSD